MKEYVLNYYPNFKCVAGECKHTCCAGWKMNIDERSLSAYKNDNSFFGDTLKKGVDFKKSRFKVDKDGRCFFLDTNGLCEIITNLGEQNLCQVCRDHPRFRTFFNDRTEMGLGFCCEQACKIILSFKDKISPQLVKDDGTKIELDFIQKNVLEFRGKVLDAIQDRNIDINHRINNLLSLCNARVEDKDFAKIVRKFLSFERLDKSWTERLKSVKNNAFTRDIATELSHYAEQFLVNSLYRYLYDAEDTYDARARTIACALGLWLVNSIFKRESVKEIDEFILIVDVVRAYSAEVEYSQKNLDKLFEFSQMFIKI